MKNDNYAHRGTTGRELSVEEIAQVSGGLPFGAVVGVGMLTDTSFWGAMAMAFGAGSWFGSVLSGMISAPSEAAAAAPSCLASDYGGGYASGSDCASGYGDAGVCGY